MEVENRGKKRGEKRKLLMIRSDVGILSFGSTEDDLDNTEAAEEQKGMVHKKCIRSRHTWSVSPLAKIIRDNEKRFVSIGRQRKYLRWPSYTHALRSAYITTERVSYKAR